MKIRNPWGKKEWKGAFGAKSEVWTQELRDLLGQSDKNDGQFWILFCGCLHLLGLPCPLGL